VYRISHNSICDAHKSLSMAACSAMSCAPMVVFLDAWCVCTIQGLAVEVQTYNLMIATCVKLGQPDSAMAIYQR
jgi:pentatricopeptide repeat protein